MKLHTYFRSSAAYRVRIAMALKGLDYESVFHHLRRGEHAAEPYRSLNPQKLVPALEADGPVITQSLAIIEYLEEVYPNPPLLPPDPAGRARVRSIALAIACDIHPINNLRVLRYLRTPLGHNEPTIEEWYRHWVAEGLGALESMLSRSPQTGAFCHDSTPTVADCCLIPQLYNARRFDCDLNPYPTLLGIEERALALPAFAEAAPERQGDAEA
ncbi:maleylacetoacetate isomerase [Inquilinus limosus]|uniref:maleylacetoacetate isomerase n=1 Tax=Inquilinus limosus TaxID=171674 RepID=UPI003F14E7B8